MNKYTNKELLEIEEKAKNKDPETIQRVPSEKTKEITVIIDETIRDFKRVLEKLED